MAERFFILDKFNTWYDWNLILTAKDVTPPEPKTYLVEIDGADGSLDLSESLAGRVVYKDRKVSADFWTDYGNRKDRERIYREIVKYLHGKKIRLIELYDPEHYFLGRVTVSALSNNLAYATFKLNATCEPWRYSIEDSVRRVDITGSTRKDVVISNNGVKILSPNITVKGSVTLFYDGLETLLTTGSYKVSDLKLRQGVNVIGVSGNGSVIFTYKEADL